MINIGPLKDFSYGYRINADLNATGITKQSNYELVGVASPGTVVLFMIIHYLTNA